MSKEMTWDEIKAAVAKLTRDLVVQHGSPVAAGYTALAAAALLLGLSGCDEDRAVDSLLTGMRLGASSGEPSASGLADKVEASR